MENMFIITMNSKLAIKSILQWLIQTVKVQIFIQKQRKQERWYFCIKSNSTTRLTKLVIAGQVHQNWHA